MSDPVDDQDDPNESLDLLPDLSITKELFEQWRAPRRGTTNPEPSNNPVWEWLIRCRWNAWRACQHFQGSSAREFGPGWCFDRFGRTSTSLPDGRIVQIAGEHEDHYDPDFFIYNDVVVQNPDGSLQIFNYPVEDFPPTDFHTAILESNRIVIIGNLGYDEERVPGTTPVFILDLDTFRMTAPETSGTPPGWLFEHQATLSADGRSIRVTGGKLELADDFGRENIDDWLLHLDDFRWEQLTDRKWQQWRLVRADDERLHLFEIQSAIWSRTIFPEGAESGLTEITEALGTEPDLSLFPDMKSRLAELAEDLGAGPDLSLFPQLYVPNLPHESIPDDDNEFNVHRIRIDGTVVKYQEGMHWIHVTIEGDLRPETIAALRSDLLQKLSTLENAPCEWKQL